MGITVLDGGLPAWKNAGYKTKNTPAEPADKSSYSVSPPLSGIATMSEVKSELQTTQIIDARPNLAIFARPTNTLNLWKI